MVGVGSVALGVHESHPGRGQRRDDVDVPAGAELLGVPRQSAGKPDDVLGADRAREFGLDVPPRPGPGLRTGSSCTVSVTSTVPRPSTWIPPPSLTIDDGDQLAHRTTR